MKMNWMKLRSMRLLPMLVVALAMVSLISCSNDDDSDNGSARITVSMTDAPGDYDAVFVDVVDVMIKADASTEGEEGWKSLGGVKTGVYDLLELTGGVTQLLADTDVPAGYLGQIRLVLGNNNTVVVNGESQALSTPSAQQSGLKIKVDQELAAGETYNFLLDFDVDQSIVAAGTSGGFALKPVIRLSNGIETGTIKGSVHPTTFQSVVKIQNASNTVSAYTDANGNFELQGVPAGLYQLKITPAVSSGLTVKIMNDVQVKTGETLDLETIFLE